MKKLVALFLCLAMVFCLCACDSNDGSNSNDDGSKTSSDTSSVASSEPEGEGDDTSSSDDGEESEDGNDYDVYVPEEENIAHDDQTGIDYVNNMIIIVFAKATPQATIDGVISSISGKVVNTDSSINQYQVNIPEKTLTELETLIASVEQNECVVFAHYDRAYKSEETALAAYLPNDSWNGDVNSADWQDSDVDGSNWWLEAIDAYGAWQYEDSFSKVKIGIVDGGFDARHEDLSLSFPGLYRLLNNRDDHGTHVAGIIGAKGNNAKGITGIVQNCETICFDWDPTWWQALLLDWKTDTMIYSGLIKTVQAGAKVVNFSCGRLNGDKEPQSILDADAKKASGYMATLLQDYDFVVVQAAGNESIDAHYSGLFAAVTPQNCVNYGTGRSSAQSIQDRILVVAAAQRNGSGYSVSWFSNGGTQVDLAAPGGDATENVDGGIYSCFVDGYGVMSGTSMAAPMVTAVVGLVWSVNENFTGDQVANIVKTSTVGVATDHPESTQTGGDFGMLNAKKAVETALAQR